jgi:hypothetical protein
VCCRRARLDFGVGCELMRICKAVAPPNLLPLPSRLTPLTVSDARFSDVHGYTRAGYHSAQAMTHTSTAMRLNMSQCRQLKAFHQLIMVPTQPSKPRPCSAHRRDTNQEAVFCALQAPMPLHCVRVQGCAVPQWTQQQLQRHHGKPTTSTRNQIGSRR